MKLTDEQKQVAIDLAIEGRTLNDIVEALFVTRYQFWKARQDDPSFYNKFERARQEGIHSMVDKLDTIHDQYEDVQKAKLASDNIKWKASKINPGTYGDRIDLNVTQTVDIGDALSEAKKRAQLPIRDVTPTLNSGESEEPE